MRERLKALAVERRFGYRRLHVLLRREGHAVNRKRVQRIYREEKLMVRRRGGRKRALGERGPIAAAKAPTARWSLDFVHDQLVHGRASFLTVVDDCTRECLGLIADTSLPGRRVARELDKIVARRSCPGSVVSDHWDRADEQYRTGLGRRTQGGLAFHSAGQTNPKRFHRELQRPTARRTADETLFTSLAPTRAALERWPRD